MNKITSFREKNYNSIETNDIESNIKYDNNDNNLYEFYFVFKKSIIQFSLIIMGFMFVFLIFYQKNGELLKSNKYGEIYNNDYDSFCSFNLILFNIFQITLITLVIILIILMLIGISILGPVEGSIFAFCQSIGCVTSGSICASIQSFIMANFHLIPVYSFISTLLISSLYSIIQCI